MRANRKQTFLTEDMQREADELAEREAAELERTAAATAAAEKRAELEQWFTPAPLAAKFSAAALRFAWQQLGPLNRPLRVLDACAGDGSLCRPLIGGDPSTYLGAVGHPGINARITMVEIDPMFSSQLKRLAPTECSGCGTDRDRCGPLLWAQQRKCCPDCSHRRSTVEVHTADFVDWAKACSEGEYDLLITNPPFRRLIEVVEGGAKISRCVAVIGPSAMTHGGANYALHEALRPLHMRDLKHRPKFSGTKIQPRRDYAVLMGVPLQGQKPRTRYRVTYGVWSERWNEKEIETT